MPIDSRILAEIDELPLPSRRELLRYLEASISSEEAGLDADPSLAATMPQDDALERILETV